MTRIFRTLVPVLTIICAFGLFFYLGFQGGVSPERPGHVPPRRPVRIDAANANLKAQMLGLPEVENEKSVAEPEAIISNDETMFQSQLKNCLNKETKLTATEFIESQLDSSVLKREIQIENFHFTLANGTERRIQTLPPSGQLASGARRIKIFSLDAENLPVPEKIPAEILRLPYARQIYALSEGREPFFSQARESVDFNDKQKMSLEWTNQKISEFQWSGPGFVFSCHGSRCHCSH